MATQQLKEALEALHRELETGEVTPEDREALLQAAREIQEAVAQSSPASAEPEGGSLSRRVSALIEELETSHPRFAEILGNVSEALANLGI